MPLEVLNLGAGVQSSNLALMFAKGQIKGSEGPIRLDAAIFSDTGAEPQSVYDWLDWLETQLPYPVYRVMEGDGLEQDLLNIEGKNRIGQPLVYTKIGVDAGPLRRKCTSEYKIKPIMKKVREMVGLKPRQRGPDQILVNQYFGISYDEASRMKPSTFKWSRHIYPLVDMDMTRGHCLEWMEQNGYPKPPRSACYFCPYKSSDEWRDLKANHPAEWQKAIEMDKHIRSNLPGVNNEAYLHRSLKPIDQVDFSNAEDAGQMSMFGDECEGMCGV